MKVRVVRRPSGLINGLSWPDVGEEIDLPQAVAESMAEAGHVEVVEEKRPASKKGVEKRAEKRG